MSEFGYGPPAMIDADTDVFGRSLEDWRRRLIDLSHRNRLIAYRGTTATTLGIIAPKISELLPDPDAGGSWQFFFPPESSEDSRLDVSEAAATVDSVMLSSRPRQPRRRLTEIEFSERNPQHLARSLDVLAKRSNAEFRDKALRVLYIAVGFLEWHDARASKDIASPLVLIPVELRRDSTRDPYHLVFVDDEEIVINPSLTEKLRRESDFGLPPDWSWDKRSIPEELDDIRRAVTPRGWSVREDAVLSLFSFQKYVMYRDLLDNQARITRHPIVRSLAQGRLEPTVMSTASAVPDVTDLDAEQKPAETLSILDADASQRLCVEAMKRGQSFVVQGPPGTGKSQTIANVIAEALGQGKRILFVSEKAAALDVVHKRLAEVGLDEYCLKLHGEHAVRRDVVQELDRSLASALKAKRGMRRGEMDQLAHLRTFLNSTAEQLHFDHALLGGRSVREVYEELAQLHAAPSIAGAPELHVTNDAVPDEYQELTEMFEGLTGRWAVSRPEFPWRGYNAVGFSIDDRARALAVLRTLVEGLHHVREASAEMATALDLPAPKTLRAAGRLWALAEHLTVCPVIEPRWLQQPPAELMHIVEDAEESYRELTASTEAFQEEFGSRPPPEIPPDGLDNLVAAVQGVRTTCGWAKGWDGGLSALPHALQALDELPRTIAAATKHGSEAAELLGQTPGVIDARRLGSLEQLCELAYVAEHRPEPDWLLQAGLDRARRLMSEIDSDLRHYQAHRDTLSEQYELAVLDEDVSALLARFTSDYTTRWSRLSASYRRDARWVKSMRKDRKVPETLIDDLELIGVVRVLGQRIDEHADWMTETLGTYAAGRDTDPAAIEAALAAAERVLELTPSDANRTRLATVLSTQSRRDAEVAALGARLRDAREAYLAQLESVGAYLERAIDPRSDLSETQSRVDEVAPPIRQLARAISEVEAPAATSADAFETVRRRASILHDLANAATETTDGLATWKNAFGDHFDAERTNWQLVRGSIRWLQQANDLLGDTPGAWLPQHMETIQLHDAAVDRLRRAHDAATAAVTGVTHLFGPERAADLEERFVSDSFAQVERTCRQLRDQVDDLHSWTEWRMIRVRAAERGWKDFVDSLIEARVTEYDVVPAFRRAYWHRRLEALFQSDEELAEDLRRASFQRWVDEFRQLDRRLVTTGPDRLISQLEKRRRSYVSAPGSEVELLRREARKQRRLMSVRDLLSRIPTLLSDLKPCLMMSPLSVSHFLSSTHHFNLVVFDEASQVPPQDAINCIYRGQQLVVAGDSRQLPPTPFFQIVEDAPATTIDAVRAEEDMESVLDACEALLLPLPLRWHYRSHSEALITFSNARVYGGGLVTFPSADETSPRRGVSLIHVHNGVYDRGRTASNRREAKVVAERVISHLANGRSSVGVIAFNTAQAQVIAEELDLLRLEHPELDEFFSGNRLDAVFVKHLEAVQGDERDVIVLSVGYGRDTDNRFTMNFGPLNLEGGFRRLNVAITRAREQFEVVASVRARDFTLSDGSSAGARMLRDYLDYAERGGRLPDAAARDNHARGWASPFEEQIATVVRDLGFEPVPNVGGGSFRIDVGVRSRATPERFILGIETDGESYVHTPTTRDRERLRHEVLARLGWGSIHRIWSLDWVQNRLGEVERLSKALVDAEADQEAGAEVPLLHMRRNRASNVRRVARRVYALNEAAEAGRLSWTRPYERVSLTKPTPAGVFNSAASRLTQAQLVADLVAAEAPVSIKYVARRLGEAWGLSRLGPRAESTALQAIHSACERGQAELRGEFLWRSGQRLSHVRIPNGESDGWRRDFADIPAEELDLAITNIRDASPSLDREQLILQVSRLFGFARAGMQRRAAIDERLRTFEAQPPGPL